MITDKMKQNLESWGPDWLEYWEEKAAFIEHRDLVPQAQAEIDAYWATLRAFKESEMKKRPVKTRWHK